MSKALTFSLGPLCKAGGWAAGDPLHRVVDGQQFLVDVSAHEVEDSVCGLVSHVWNHFLVILVPPDLHKGQFLPSASAMSAACSRGVTRRGPVSR
ncbi:hypothetical protein LWC34_51590 [Kibdelosporangium philippinense]|uniref:Uncharacterized protein n=1 Tax=Kibdelosporangium philippinense TaxID=211113 RepID=A0ABS8ZU16_9PSEU|nr:hypothetical protein [Kibdelosporangium philippinense]MCE7011198.1 hypothetical protein [Kibdelosporangium philippinense]